MSYLKDSYLIAWGYTHSSSSVVRDAVAAEGDDFVLAVDRGMRDTKRTWCITVDDTPDVESALNCDDAVEGWTRVEKDDPRLVVVHALQAIGAYFDELLASLNDIEGAS